MSIAGTITAILVCYATWLGMLAVHEFGHISSAWISGGKVISVSFPLFGFSQTIVHPNPHELFEIWAGPVVGAMLPLMVLGIWRFTSRNVPEFLRFFAGFCCVANGAYIGLGWIRHAGDAGDLQRLGTAIPAMIGFGAACIVLGLLCWHYTSWLRIAYWQGSIETIRT